MSASNSAAVILRSLLRSHVKAALLVQSTFFGRAGFSGTSRATVWPRRVMTTSSPAATQRRSLVYSLRSWRTVAVFMCYKDVAH